MSIGCQLGVTWVSSAFHLKELDSSTARVAIVKSSLHQFVTRADNDRTQVDEDSATFISDDVISKVISNQEFILSSLKNNLN